MKTSFNQKSLALFFGLLLISSLGGLSIPRTAQAQVGAEVVTDPGNLVVNSTSAVTAAKQLLGPIFFALARATIQSIVKSTVNWINSGFKGSPAFATNLATTLQAVSDAQANSFLRQLGSNSAIKSPFQNQVYQTVSQNYFKSTGSNAFFNQNPYTLNKVTPNDTAFLNGATTQGGMNAWLATVMNPGNNPLGATLFAQNALTSSVAGAVQQQLTELSWAQGFFGYRGNSSCSSAGTVTPNAAITPTQPATVQLTNNNITPSDLNSTLPTVNLGGAVEPAAASDLGTINLNPPATLTGAGGSPTDTIVLPSSSFTGTDLGPVNAIPSNPLAGTSADPSAALGSSASLSASAPCLGSSIQTPGATIKASLDKVLGSGVDSLVSAHDFDEIVNALLGQLMNQVLGPTGLGGLSGAGTSAGSSSGYLNQTDGSQASINASLNSDFSQALTSQMTQLQQFQSQVSIINNAALAAKAALAAHACTTNQSLLTGTVQPVLDQMAKALSGANYFLTQLTAIQNAIPQPSDPNATVELSTISAAYSALQATTTPYALPNSTDYAYVAAQSVDTGTSTPQSLYTEMNQIAQKAASCQTTTSGT